jgi:hypothetical protein
MNKKTLYILIPIIMVITALIVISNGSHGDKTADQVQGQLTTQEEITKLLSEKEKLPANTLVVKVDIDTGLFSKGLINYTSAAGGGVWFAAKVNNKWELAFVGNGIVTCDSISKYNFPKDIIPNCVDTKAGTLVQR